jgi:hypothetical protein
VSRTRLSRGLALTALAASAVALSGCQLPDVSMSQNLTPPSKPAAPAATPSHPAQLSASPAAQAAPLRPSGDLDTGALTHSLPAGSRQVVVNYWTTEDAKSWGPKGNKNIQIAAHVEGGGTLAEVKVTRFLATADDGVHRTTVVEDRGEFVITPPYSYTTALTVTPSDPTATALTLYAQFELLVETYPDSGEFFRQTVLDTIHLPFLLEDKK